MPASVVCSLWVSHLCETRAAQRLFSFRARRRRRGTLPPPGSSRESGAPAVSDRKNAAIVPIGISSKTHSYLFLFDIHTSATMHTRRRAVPSERDEA